MSPDTCKGSPGPPSRTLDADASSANSDGKIVAQLYAPWIDAKDRFVVGMIAARFAVVRTVQKKVIAHCFRCQCAVEDSKAAATETHIASVIRVLSLPASGAPHGNPQSIFEVANPRANGRPLQALLIESRHHPSGLLSQCIQPPIGIDASLAQFGIDFAHPLDGGTEIGVGRSVGEKLSIDAHLPKTQAKLFEQLLGGTLWKRQRRICRAHCQVGLTCY
jgi:hypothetical protein